MEHMYITEIVKVELLESATEEQLMSKAAVINNFVRRQDGFVDAELTRQTGSAIFYFIYHFTCMDKLKEIGLRMREAKIFDEITPIIVPGSLNVIIQQQLQTWR